MVSRSDSSLERRPSRASEDGRDPGRIAHPLRVERLPQDERRAIFEDRSHHIARSVPYLPRIARRLHHSRDLGEPFDFITWFEFAPRDAAAFDELAGMMRATEEWTYVEREVEIRLTRGHRRRDPGDVGQVPRDT